MFNGVQLVRDLCKERNIPIAKLEKDCGFANGYLNPKKMSKIPYDRAVIIAEYLGVSANLILTGAEEETKKSPTEQTLDEGTQRLIAAILELPPEKQKALADLIGVDY